jgi:hypothetical protein
LDLAIVAALYIAVVARFRVAFTVFTVANVLRPRGTTTTGPRGHSQAP